MRYTSDKEVNSLLATYVRKGWRVEHRGSGHLTLRSPAGPGVTLARTPSDFRAVLNLRSQIRRVEKSIAPKAGLVEPKLHTK
jgi:hypothetical protein